MAIAASQIKPLQMWAGRIGHGFLLLATLVMLYAGWVFGGGKDNPVMALLMGAIFGLCPAAVAYLLPFVSVARAHGKNGMAAVMMVGAVIAGAMELRGELMVFAGKRAASSTDAMLKTAIYERATKSVTLIEGRLAEAQAKLKEQASAGTSASYESRIKAAEDLAAREGSKNRGGCKAKCDEALKLAADLRAQQAIALDRETKTEPLVNQLVTELDEAKRTANQTKTGDSMSVAESETLASLWNMSLSPSQDSKRWADLMAGVFMAVFLLVVPTMLIYASKIDWHERPAKRSNGTLHKLMAWLRGEPMPSAPDVARETVNNTTTVQEPAPTPVAPMIEQRYAPPPTTRISTRTLGDIKASLRLLQGAA